MSIDSEWSLFEAILENRFIRYRLVMDVVFTKMPKHINLSKVLYAMEFYESKLIRKGIQKNLNVQVKFDPNLRIKHGRYAQCYWVYENRAPRDFIIEIDSGMSESKIIKILAHEMAHVKQYVNGDIYDYIKFPSKTRWKKTTIDKDSMDYWEYPWEIEAHGYEICLYEMFKEHMRKLNIRKRGDKQ